jgi:hypothetical protein
LRGYVNEMINLRSGANGWKCLLLIVRIPGGFAATGTLKIKQVE